MTLSLAIAEWLTAWSQTSAGQALMAGLPAERAGLAAAVPRLRKSGLTAEQTSAVVELVELRQRAKSKFPDAEQLFFTRRGYEQSSGQALAAWKTECLRRQWPAESPLVVDLCCGVGGDLRELAREFPCLGVERDPAVAHFAEANLRSLPYSEDRGSSAARVFCGPVERLLDQEPVDIEKTGPALSSTDADGTVPTRAAASVTPEAVTSAAACTASAASESVTSASATSVSATSASAASESALGMRAGATSAPSVTAGEMEHWPAELRVWIEQQGLSDRRVVWHLDPDRRDATGRHTRWEDMSPGPNVVEALLAGWGAGVVKLAPATEISADWQARGHWQWLGWARECKQLLGWFGCEPQFPAGKRSAVVWDRDRAGWQVWSSEVSRGGATERVAATAEPQAILFEPHAAVYAARLAEGLAAEHGWRRLTGGDYFTCETTAASLGELCAAFQVLEVVPLRLPTVRAWLEQHSAVITEVKSRAVSEPLAAGLKEWVGRGWSAGDGPRVSLLLFTAAGGRGGISAGGVAGPSSDRPAKVAAGSGAALRVAICRRVGAESVG